MGRSPCCDEIGIKKGPWTPEEDIILIAYIQEHDPRNWRSIPTNTGLMRCSKSCRLRWTNYLRPGIKRGNFTPHEERMIIHLQSLLGNRWASIASYLPQRTDNDIKNYWNTHIKKRIKKCKAAVDSYITTADSAARFRHEPNTIRPIFPRFMNTYSTYASSTENISRLLKDWMTPATDKNANTTMATSTVSPLKPEQQELSPEEKLDSLLTFENLASSDWDNNSSSDMFETWILDEAAEKIEDLMEQLQ